MKVGISFVSTATRRRTSGAEDPGWSVRRLWPPRRRQRGTPSSAASPSGGGTAAEQHTFYTALYHSLLFPNVVSDVNGDYAGSDGKVHTDHRVGRSTPTSPSGTSTAARSNSSPSLESQGRRRHGPVARRRRRNRAGWLPKWAIVGGDESQMNGDSADPIIADAYAMGVRNFDVAAALTYMVKGATQNETNHGLEIERQYLSQYLTQHYVNAGSLDLTSIDYSIGGSATLEYAIDDFCHRPGRRRAARHARWPPP